MKQEILDKLFNNEELTSQELVYVSKALNSADVEDIIPYVHTDENTLVACGLTESYVRENNEELKKVFKDWHGQSRSEIVEKIESMAFADPKFFRIVVLHFVKSVVRSGEEDGDMPDEIKEIKKLIEDKLGTKGKIKFIRGDAPDMDRIDKHFEMLKFLMEMKKKFDKEEGKDSE